MFDQTFAAQDLAVIGLLIILEGVLSIDNALVLGLLARKLPKYLQGRALTYGLIGAFVFRFIAIATATYLLRWWFVKFLGGAYLIYVAVKSLFFEGKSDDAHEIQLDAKGRPIIPDAVPADGPVKLDYAPSPQQHIHKEHIRQFWSAVLVIELTDIAFAIDSILAAIALVAGGHVPEHGFHPKLWVIITGGFLGVVLMRFAAIVFIKLLDRFPRFEMAAYLLVAVIGFKLLADWYFNKRPEGAPDTWHAPLDFHSASSPVFWVFWGLMIICFCVGFLPQRKSKVAEPTSAD